MDAWEPTSFGNDTACDWLAEVLETSNWEMIDEAFENVLEAGDEMLDSGAGEEGLAAAEIVAWGAGRPGPNEEGTEDLQDWLDENELEPSESRLKRAIRVVSRIFAEPSELRDAWEESGDFESWRKAVTDLKDRLKG